LSVTLGVWSFNTVFNVDSVVYFSVSVGNIPFTDAVQNWGVFSFQPHCLKKEETVINTREHKQCNVRLSYWICSWGIETVCLYFCHSCFPVYY
jgi:hypothetical protein